MKLSYRMISIILLISLTLCLGSTFLFSVLALNGLSALAVGASRIIIAGFFLFIILKISGQSLVDNSLHWKYVSIYGSFFTTLPFLALSWALQYVNTSAAAIYYSSIPLFILVLSNIFLKTTITKRKFNGFIIGSIGLIVLATIDNDQNYREFSLTSLDTFFPHFVLFLSAFGLAAGGVFVQAMPKIQPLSMTTSAFLAGNAIALPILLMSLPEDLPPNTTILNLLGVGIIATGFGTLIRGILIQREGIIFTSKNGYLVPIYSSILGFIFLSETPTVHHGLAYLLVVVGLIISSR